MTSETEDKAYELFAQILQEAGQLETKMNSIRSIIGNSSNPPVEQRHAYLHSLVIYLSQQAEGYASGAQELCRLIEECKEVLNMEDNQSQ